MSEIGTGSDTDSLTPRQTNALWEIASGAPQVRERFLELLSTDPDFVIRLGANASMIYRALGLTWPQSTKQMRAALGPILDAIAKTTNSGRLQSLVQAAAALDPKPEQAQAALGPVLDAIAKTTDPFALQSLVQAAAALDPKPEQAQAALGPVLDAIAKTTNSNQLGSLAQAAAALAPTLSPEQAQNALGPVLGAIAKTTDLFALQSLAHAAAALAPKPEQAQAALGPVLDAIAKTTFRVALQSLAHAAAALAPTLSPEQAQAALGRVGSALGWAGSAGEAQEWVRAFVALLARVPDPRSSSRALVDVLKFPITGGKPTDELLLALKKYLPQLPGPDAGLSVNLDWLRQNEPSINLISRAVCPPPPREQLHCPIQAGS